MGDEAIRGTASALTVQMLAWLSSEPRTYVEAMDAWRTSCPRLSVWEDAIADGHLQVVRTANKSWVSLTAQGTAVLREASPLVGSAPRSNEAIVR